MELRTVKYGNEKYYQVHENKDTPQELKDKLIKGQIEQSFYSFPYIHYKILK